MNHDASWHMERREGIGGSEAGTILGVSKWSTIDELYEEKIGAKQPDGDKPHLLRGRMLEPLIVELYRMKHPNAEVEIHKDRFYHPEYGFVHCEVDGFILDENLDRVAVLECKAFDWQMMEDLTNNGLQRYVIAQAQHNMLVTGLEWCHVVVLDIGQWEIEVFPIQKNEAIQEKMLESYKKFWFDHVEKQIPPTPQYPVDVPAVKSEATPTKRTDWDWMVLGDKYAKIHAMKKQIEAMEKECKAEIQGLIDESETKVEGHNLKVSWSYTKDKEVFDEVAFAATHPDLHKKFIRTKAGYRQFRVTPTKKLIT